MLVYQRVYDPKIRSNKPWVSIDETIWVWVELIDPLNRWCSQSETAIHWLRKANYNSNPLIQLIIKYYVDKYIIIYIYIYMYIRRPQTAAGGARQRTKARHACGRSNIISSVLQYHGVQKVTFGTVGCWPAGPIRPSGPWRLGPARGSLDPSRAARQSRFREGLKLVSTVFRRWRLARWAAGRRAWSVLQGHGVWALRGGPLTRAVPHDRAGLGKVWSWFLRCSEGDVWHGGLLAGGLDPSFRAMVFVPCEGVPWPEPGRSIEPV